MLSNELPASTRAPKIACADVSRAAGHREQFDPSANPAAAGETRRRLSDKGRHRRISSADPRESVDRPVLVLRARSTADHSRSKSACAATRAALLLPGRPPGRGGTRRTRMGFLAAFGGRVRAKVLQLFSL